MMLPACKVGISMKLIKPTPWETRNLGVESFVVCPDFYQAPSEQGLLSEIHQATREHAHIFIFARVEKRNHAANAILERIGFNFVEQTLEPYIVLSKSHVLKQFVKNRADFLPKRFTPSDFDNRPLDKVDQNACAQVSRIASQSFSDDRFHLDPKCDHGKADSRFVFWVQDLLADSQTAFNLLCFKDEVIGFMARKAEHLVLAGFSRKHLGSGLGEYLWLSVLADMQAGGRAHAHTLISANNVSVLNLYARLGFKFRNPATTFHYWG